MGRYWEGEALRPRNLPLAIELAQAGACIYCVAGGGGVTETTAASIIEALGGEDAGGMLLPAAPLDIAALWEAEP